MNLPDCRREKLLLATVQATLLVCYADAVPAGGTKEKQCNSVAVMAFIAPLKFARARLARKNERSRARVGTFGPNEFDLDSQFLADDDSPAANCPCKAARSSVESASGFASTDSRTETPEQIVEPFDDVEEHRRQKNAKQRHAQHAAEDGGAQRAAHFGAGAFRQHQRHHAQNEGERRHHDRPQSQAASFQRRFVSGFAGLAPGPGELDNQNRVLARQARSARRSRPA